MGRRKGRRHFTDHRGVKLKRVSHRSGSESWVAIWRDPARPFTGNVSKKTGKPVPRFEQQSLDAIGCTTDEQRREWARKKADQLRQQKARIKLGGDEREKTETPLRDAVKDYFETLTRKKPNTVRGYRIATDAFVDYVVKQGVSRVEDLRKKHLTGFRDQLAKRRRKHAAPGGTRGERREESDSYLSPVTVNNALRPIVTLLRHWRKRDLLPNLTRDDIGEALEREKTKRPRPQCLRPPELARLIAAALRHDADCFALTREQKDQCMEGGTTARYEPVAPFLAVLLLTGMRFSEAQNLRWRDVHLGAGTAGEIVLMADDVKTGHERAVNLVVSPGLKKILEALKVKAGSQPYVFGGKKPWQRSLLEAARKRLMGTKRRKPKKEGPLKESGYGAPRFTWQMLRQTCGSYLTNAPGIFGAASAWHSAKQLGHSVTIAEKHYVGRIEVSREAKDLDAAMMIESLLALIVRRITGELGPKELLKILKDDQQPAVVGA